MEEEIKLSRDLFKTVSTDTRVDILKLLDNRQMTASELGRALNKHVTTITEHLDVLKNSNLVERIERPGHKWIYYKLTYNASQILHPKFYYKWAVVLSISILAIGVLGAPFVDANPGDPLYTVDRFVEKVRLALANDEEKAKLHLQFADERLKEAKVVAERNKTKSTIETTIKITGEYKKEIESTNVEIEKVKESGKNVIPLLEEVEESSSKHISILENIQKKQPESKPEIKPILEYSKENQAKIKEDLIDISSKIQQETPRSASLPEGESRVPILGGE